MQVFLRVYVVNKKYEFLGILTADDASKAVKKHGRLLIYYLTIFLTVYLDTLLEEMYAKMAEMQIIHYL